MLLLLMRSVTLPAASVQYRGTRALAGKLGNCLAQTEAPPNPVGAAPRAY
jgi:hypothetical protein